LTVIFSCIPHVDKEQNERSAAKKERLDSWALVSSVPSFLTEILMRYRTGTDWDKVRSIEAEVIPECDELRRLGLLQ
jgi:hypothetical protein